MFNGKFGLIRFGLKEQPREIRFSSYCVETVNAVVGGSKRIPFCSEIHEEFRAQVTAVHGLPFSSRCGETFNSQVTGGVNVLFQSNCREDISCTAASGKDIHFQSGPAETVQCKAVPGKKMWFRSETAEAVQCKAQPGKNLHFSSALSEIVSAQVSSYTLERETAVLNIAIPPGGTFVLDTENFNAYLNKGNVIHLHSGDWPTIDRNAVELVIDSGTGGRLDGVLLYREAFL